MKKQWLLLTLAIATAGLVGCTHVTDDNNSQVTDGSENGVMTSGIGGGDGAVNGAQGSYLGHDYSTVAPSNQKYYFDFDSNEVHNEYQPSIQSQGKYASAHPGARIRLEGNTDVRGSREYNIALGERRARAVSQSLSAAGATNQQLSVISYGAERPVAKGSSDDDHQQNRRVDLTYETK
jgi:peptidoglycan-associated lipoprotein